MRIIRFAENATSCVANLCDQLRSKNLANTEHIHYNIVFGKLFRKRGHLPVKLYESFTGAVQLRGRLFHQSGYVIAVRERWSKRFGIVVYSVRFLVGVIITVLVAPTVILILESAARYFTNTVAMWELDYEIRAKSAISSAHQNRAAAK